jgi:hypothetical protein
MPPSNKNNTRRKNNNSNNNNSNIRGLAFFEEPVGKPPRHPGAPKGPITPRNRKGRPKNIQTYPEVHLKEPTVADKIIRFRSAANLRRKPYINTNFKKGLTFGRLVPKTWEELQRMPLSEYRKWLHSLTRSEQEELLAFL